MPKFLYTAKAIDTGQPHSGEMVARDEKELAQELRKQGMLLTSHREMAEKTQINIKFFDRFQSVPLKEKMIFTRNLAVMVSSGLTLSRGIHNLSLQTTHKGFSKILQDVFEEVQGGKTLSEGLAKYPKIFNELFTNMVAVGEVSGNLEEVLDILATQLEKEHDLSSKVRGALIYPMVIVVAMIGIGILMLTYILPKITGVFKEMEVELPPTTRAIMSASDFLIAHYIIVFGGSVLMIMAVNFFAKTDTGRAFFGRLYLYLPIVGNIVVKVNCARFARIHSSLLKSGVSVVTSLGIVSKTLGNVHYKEALEDAIGEIQKGTDLSKIIARYPKLFPILVPQILEVGE